MDDPGYPDKLPTFPPSAETAMGLSKAIQLVLDKTNRNERMSFIAMRTERALVRIHDRMFRQMDIFFVRADKPEFQKKAYE